MNETYPVLEFQGEPDDFYIKYCSRKSDMGAEVFNSKLGRFIQSPVVDNNFANITFDDKPSKQAAVSKTVKLDGYEYATLSEIIGRKLSKSRLYFHGDYQPGEKFCSSDIDYISSFKINKLIGHYFKDAPEEFKAGLVDYYLFSELIQNADQCMLNNVPAWAWSKDTKDMSRLKNAPALDFADTDTFHSSEVFEKPINPRNFMWILKNYPNVVKSFMSRLDAIRGDGFKKLTDFKDVAEFFDGDEIITGERLQQGFRKRAVALQNQFAVAKRL